MPTPRKTAASGEPPTEPGLITTHQLRQMHALLRDHGLSGDVTIHDYIAAWLTENGEDPVESRKDLPTTVAAKIIRDLQRADVTTAPGGLIRAMLAVQAELPMVQKTKTAEIEGRASYSYTYADLADVTAAAIPLLNKNGLVFMATPRRTEGGGYEIVGVLEHVSGETREGALPLHGNDPRQIGGALTYHRRYLLGSMLGIVTDDDVDGRQAARASRTREWDGPSTLELLGQIGALAGRAGITPESAEETIRIALNVVALDDVDPWVLAPRVEQLRAHAERVEEAARAEAGPTTEELLAQLESYRQRRAPEVSWEEFSAKFRDAHGGISVEELPSVPAERVGQWEAEVAAWIAANPEGTQ